jgi:tetratricopeptide (TPR) repeat protein
VRDEFKAPVKATLAMRVGHRCSDPDCGAVTSGPGIQPDKYVNVGVAAHITAASRGGPRFDETLGSAERGSASNGIWLCQTCAKLIDSDVDRYTVELLKSWKAQAEEHARKMLATGVGYADDSINLTIPALGSTEALLSFADVSIPPVGREHELEELSAFLEADRPFAWWVWMGPAGVGKSRLAIELCRIASSLWHAGFLREVDESPLDDFQPLQPTLIVVDYAAQRSEWLSDVLLRLSQRTLSAPVRVLILERDAAGPWWNVVQRLNRFEESVQLAEAAYGMPRELNGLSRDDIRELVRATGTTVGKVLSSTNVEDIADHAEEIDPSGRPLFALVATIDWLDGRGVSTGRDEALRRLLTRMDAQTAERLADAGVSQRVRNLRTLASALGGMPVDDYSQVLADRHPPTGLLPGVFDDFGGLSLAELLEGVRPDILGELYVLDRLGSGGVEPSAAKALLRLAWQTNPDAYHAFVQRSAGDHREHPNLVDLLDAADWSNSPVASATLAADTVPLLRRSDHPVLEWIFARLETIQEASKAVEIDELVATARFRFANLVLNEGDFGRANAQYADVLSQSDPSWSVHVGALNNRGITSLELGRKEAAVADFTEVIEAATATDEQRASALNNRADVYERDGELSSAVADRTAVLRLSETTYDRRFIALGRRSRALRKLGDDEGAYRDIDAILATPDIAAEQKMEARLVRAEWLMASGAREEALAELTAVAASPRNFEQVEERAGALLDDLEGNDAEAS